MSSAIARLLGTAAAGLLAASCVLLVSPSTYGDRCKLSGEETLCGRCLRDRCQPMIDGCCKDASCSATLNAVESCAVHSDSTCNDLATRKSAPARDGELATCAMTQCAAVCRAFSGTSETKCAEPVFGRGATCSCVLATAAGNDFECSPESYPATLCCAPSSWPADGLECTCLPLGCHATPDGCSCALVDTPPDKSACSADKCCTSTIDPDQCVCRKDCFDAERRVPSCSLTAQVANVPAIGCKKGQIRVKSCAIRKP